MNFLQGKTLLCENDESIEAEVALKNTTLILYYFTALNCNLCRTFEPKLREVINEATRRKFCIAVIMVACDSKKENYETNKSENCEGYFSLPFEDELNKILPFNYGITHMPALIVVRKSGEIVTRNGVGEVEEIGANVLVTWSE